MPPAIVATAVVNSISTSVWRSMALEYAAGRTARKGRRGTIRVAPVWPMPARADMLEAPPPGFPHARR
jgi:hypothetical protein